MSRQILSQSQAEAVYTVMCTLNNVGGRAELIELGGQRGDPEVRMSSLGPVTVDVGVGTRYTAEHYPDQSAFATAYGLSQG